MNDSKLTKSSGHRQRGSKIASYLSFSFEKLDPQNPVRAAIQWRKMEEKKAEKPLFMVSTNRRNREIINQKQYSKQVVNLQFSLVAELDDKQYIDLPYELSPTGL